MAGLNQLCFMIKLIYVLPINHYFYVFFPTRDVCNDTSDGFANDAALLFHYMDIQVLNLPVYSTFPLSLIHFLLNFFLGVQKVIERM